MKVARVSLWALIAVLALAVAGLTTGVFAGRLAGPQAVALARDAPKEPREADKYRIGDLPGEPGPREFGLYGG